MSIKFLWYSELAHNHLEMQLRFSNSNNFAALPELPLKLYFWLISKAVTLVARGFQLFMGPDYP